MCFTDAASFYRFKVCSSPALSKYIRSIFQTLFTHISLSCFGGFPSGPGPVVKNLPAMQETQEILESVPGLGRCPRGGHGNPLQYSCLQNPMDWRAWWATVHRVSKSQIWLKELNTNVCTYFTFGSSWKLFHFILFHFIFIMMIFDVTIAERFWLDEGSDDS